MQITKITASRRIQDIIDFIKSKNFNIADIVNKVDENDLGMYMLGAKHQSAEEIGGALND